VALPPNIASACFFIAGNTERSARRRDPLPRPDTGALDRRRQLALLELLQRPRERIFDQGPIQ